MKTPSLKLAFTLPEVLITSVVLMVLIIPISRIAYTTVLQTRYAKDVGTAISAGEQQLENFSIFPYATISSGSTQNGNMALVWTVNELNEAKIVNLTISWTTLSKTHSLNLNAAYVNAIDGGFTL